MAGLIHHEKEKIINTKQLFSYRCPSCNFRGATDLLAVGHYFSLNWIPFWSNEVVINSVCGNCGYFVHQKELPAELKKEAESFKADNKAPLWMFSGMFVMGAIIVVILVFAFFNEKQSDTYLVNPKVGDKYEMKLTSNWILDNEYTIFILRDFTKDSATFDCNDRVVYKTSGLSSIDKPENYGQNIIKISRKDLEEEKEFNIVIIEREGD